MDLNDEEFKEIMEYNSKNPNKISLYRGRQLKEYYYKDRQITEYLLSENMFNGFVSKYFSDCCWELEQFIVKNEEEDKNMKYLYEVIAVGDNEKIFLENKVVAINEEDAKLKSGLYKMIETTEGVTIIVRNLGQVKVKESN